MQQQVNHPNRRGKFELTFWGGPPRGITYRRYHKTIEQAREVAHFVLAKMSNRAAHPAIIYNMDTGEQLETIQ